MRTYDELSRTEQETITTLFANWLKDYTHEVIIAVLKKRDEIINNEFALRLLRELNERESQENKSFNDSIRYLLSNYDDFREYDPHNHPLTHAKSYRDILRDMYIA